MILSIVAVAPRGASPAAFLDALLAQRELRRDDVEVLLVHGGSPAAAPASGVRLIDAGEQASIFDLWGAGLSTARGRHVAFLDVRCPPEPGWAAETLAAAADDGAILFGPVSCAWSPLDSRYIGYLVEYVQFQPPIGPELDEVPGVNVVIRREVAAAPAVLRDGAFAKGRALAYAQQQGLAAARVLPAAVVNYRKGYAFGSYCLHRYRHGRCFAADRAAQLGGRRWLFMLGAPMLPALRLWRILRHARRAPRAMRGLGRWLHHIIAAETAWSFGELMGYALGEGRCRPRLQ